MSHVRRRSRVGAFSLPLLTPALALALAVTPALAGCCLVSIADHPYKHPAALRAALQSDRVILVDVRSPAEYRSGHIPGAINIPYQQIERSLKRLPPGRDIVLYCKSGIRDRIARRHLGRLGYRRVFSFCSYTRWKGKLVPGDASDASDVRSVRSVRGMREGG